MLLLVPVMEPSVAVIFLLPKVLRVALKVRTPFVKVSSAGRVARESVLVKCTVPA